jgi:hypothetical protein
MQVNSDRRISGTTSHRSPNTTQQCFENLPTTSLFLLFRRFMILKGNLGYLGRRSGVGIVVWVERTPHVCVSDQGAKVGENSWKELV